MTFGSAARDANGGLKVGSDGVVANDRAANANAHVVRASGW